MESWDNTDSELLTKLYVNDKLELLEICRIMKRKCKIITTKLIELKIVKSKYEIRGSSLSEGSVQNINTFSNNNLNQTTKNIYQTQNDTIVLLENINKIITQASIIYDNFSKLSKNFYRSKESTQSENNI
jgi:hypothetical protein